MGCWAGKITPGPSDDFDLFELADGFVVGLFYGGSADVLTAEEQVQAAWLELKTDDPAALRDRLLAFGVRQIDYADKTRFYFQDPAGQVWRVAGLDGGI